MIRSVLQQAGGWGQIVSQYTRVYCDQVRETSRVVLQYSHCTCDMALGWERKALRWARGMRAAGAGACAGRTSSTGVGRWVGLLGARGVRQAGARGCKRTLGRRWRTARGVRQQALGRPGGDTAEGPAVTRPRLLRHGASARCARGHAQPGRRQGVLAGSGWCTVHLAQF